MGLRVLGLLETFLSCWVIGLLGYFRASGGAPLPFFGGFQGLRFWGLGFGVLDCYWVKLEHPEERLCPFQGFLGL